MKLFRGQLIRLEEKLETPKEAIKLQPRRNSFKSCLDKKVDLYTVKRLAGHKTSAMTARYSHLSSVILQNVITKLQGGMERITMLSKTFKL